MVSEGTGNGVEGSVGTASEVRDRDTGQVTAGLGKV
jgi:hypothetical protein